MPVHSLRAVAAALDFKKAKPDPDRQTEWLSLEYCRVQIKGAVFAHTLGLLLR